MRFTNSTFHSKSIGFLLSLVFLIYGCIKEEPPLYTLNISINIDEAGSVAGAGEYNSGSEIILSATASEGYEFDYWSKGDTLLDTQHETTFIMPANDVTLMANFRKSEYSIVVNIIPEEGGVVEGQGDYQHGDNVTLNATANDYHRFLYWTNEEGQILEEDSVYTFEMPIANKVINAVFERPQYFLSLFASPQTWGNPVHTGYYYWGEEVTISANPVDHVDFIHWTVQDETIASTQETFTFTMPSDSVSYTAWFEVSYGFVADIDYNIYPVITIGNQQWMAENLAVTRYNDGSPIITGLSPQEWVGNTEGATTVYTYEDISGLNSQEEVVQAYGRLYNWYAVNHSSNLCPAGWSVPSLEQWNQLINYLVLEHDMVNDESDTDKTGVANALKSCRQTFSPLGPPCQTSVHPRWDTFIEDPDFEGPNMQIGLDLFGFSALPGGRIGNYGFPTEIGQSAQFWTSDSLDEDSAHAFLTAFVKQSLTQLPKLNKAGFSVRCIQD